MSNMKPSSQAVEEWAKSVASKDKRPLTEKEATEFIKYFMSQKDLDEDKELIEILDQKKGGYSSVLWLVMTLANNKHVVFDSV